MNTAENKRSVMVGVFVSVGLLIFMVGIFTLGGKQKKFVSTLAVKAVFDDVAGLRPGNNVWFSGVKIGTVQQINLNGNAQSGPKDVEIIMSIEESAQDFIRKDALAKISSESLIGNKNVEIFGGSARMPPVQEGDQLKAAQMLKTEDVMATLQKNNDNLLAVTNDFKLLSSRLTRGEGTIGALLTDSTLADNLRAVVNGLERTTHNTENASGALAQLTTKLNNKRGLVNQLLTDTTVFSQLRGSVAQLQHTTASAAATTDNLNQATNRLHDQNNALGVLLNDQQFAAQLKHTMGNLETGTQKLDQNMEALQHNFLLRGFFKKKDKEKQKALQKAQEDE